MDLYVLRPMKYVCQVSAWEAESVISKYSLFSVRIYWRAHVEDWCVVTWRDCTWCGWGYLFWPPHPPKRSCTYACHSSYVGWRGKASSYVHGSIYRMWAMVACSILTWLGTWWQGASGWPPFHRLGRAHTLPSAHSRINIQWFLRGRLCVSIHGITALGVSGGIFALTLPHPLTESCMYAHLWPTVW
jgi:hypothetical protein